MPPRCCAVPKEDPAAIVERASGVVRGSVARALEAFRDGPSIWLKHKQNVRHDENLIMAGVLFIVKRGDYPMMSPSNREPNRFGKGCY